MDFSAVSPSWRERWLRFRNALIADARFRRWAADFPPTAWFARKQAGALFDLVAGFVYSQILAACVQLDLFDRLAEAPLTAAELALRAALAPEAAGRLLKAAAALGLCEALGDGRYALGLRGAALRANPGIAAMIAHHALLYADLADPLAMLRGVDSKLAAFWAYARNNDPARAQDDAVQPYSQLMASSQAMIADDVLDGYSLARHRVLLDIGGGEGVFLTAAGRRHAHLRLMLFDLPAVIARARARFDAAGLSARATLSGGNFFADPIPRGADVIALVRILHDHDDAAVHALLSRVRAALPPGGTVLVAEPLAGTPGARAMGDAYFGIYLAAMGSGRPRTCQELGAMLRNAGFRDPRLRRTRMPLLVQVMTANT